MRFRQLQKDRDHYLRSVHVRAAHRRAQRPIAAAGRPVAPERPVDLVSNRRLQGSRLPVSRLTFLSIMVGVLLIAALLVVLLLIGLAVFAKNPSLVESARLERAFGTRLEQRRIAPRRLRALVIELCEAMGLDVSTEAASSDEASMRLAATQHGPLRDTRHLVFVEAEPAGDIVEPTRVLEVSEQVRSERGAVGLLITPYAIERSGTAGLDAAVELIDGPRLRELVALHLPHRLGELDGYRLGRPEPPPRPRPPRGDVDEHEHVPSRA